MMRRIYLAVMLLGSVSGAGCDLYFPNDATAFEATLSGDAERPDPVVTDGMGTATFTLSADESQLNYNIVASDLSGDVTGAHFHFSADGAAGSGGIIFAITDTVVNDGDGGATAEGVWNLTAEDVLNLRLNYIYVNLHTEANLAGEIRGNLVPAS